jgi:multidrug efflux pump subunit AcrA (membrane-fusion protein)
MWNFLGPSVNPASKILFSLLAITLCMSCGGARSADAPRGNSNTNTDAGPTVAITVAKVEARQVPAYIQATGSLVADETSDIAPKTAGKIKNVMANVGEFVSQGSVIATIDDKDARLQLASAQAGVKQAVAGVRQAEARLGLSPNGTFNSSTIPEVRGANANYQQALAELRQAEANEKRYRELVETGDVALITYETYRTTRDTARARVNSAKEQLDASINTAKQSNQAIASAQAAVEAARTQVGTAEQAIADTVIRAPFSGFISNRPVAVGEYVSSASIVATLLRSNPIKIQIQISEADVPTVVLGRGVSVQVDAFKDRNFAGTVTAVNPAIDATSRSAVVEARIDNGENLLRTGMFGTARITKEGGGTGIFVPKSAVYNDASTQSYRAFVVVEGIVKLRVLQLGTEEGDSVQILDGLNAGETVATSNLDQLYEGAKVAS